MSERARKLLHDAMALPLPERAELATDLLASLDGEPDSEAEAAWIAEIERRAREALADPDDDIAWETVRAELHQQRGAHRVAVARPEPVQEVEVVAALDVGRRLPAVDRRQRELREQLLQVRPAMERR